jgi:hypothetical protein
MITLQQAREVLGKEAENMTDQEVTNLNSMLEYLSRLWLDDYEKKVFGKTIKMLLTDRSGGSL